MSTGHPIPLFAKAGNYKTEETESVKPPRLEKAWHVQSTAWSLLWGRWGELRLEREAAARAHRAAGAPVSSSDYSKWNGRPCWILSSCVKGRKRRHSCYSNHPPSRRVKQRRLKIKLIPGPNVLLCYTCWVAWGAWGTTTDETIILCAGISASSSKPPF